MAGKRRLFRVFGAASATFFCVGVAFAQMTQPQLKPQTLDLSKLSRVQQSAPAPGVIDFENVEGKPVGAGIELSNQYAKSHGLTFGRGDSVHFCAQPTDDVNMSLCTYPRAASGQRAAAHDVSAGGPAMELRLARPVEAISMRINPTGGKPDEVFVAIVTGFGGDGEQLVRESNRFNWRQNAFEWPTSAGFKTAGAAITRVTIELRRVAQDNLPVRFLIDDLALGYTPARQVSPVAAALSAQRLPPKVGKAVVVQSPKTAAQKELRLYPAAVRKRAAIDWDAVDETLAQQKERGLKPAAYQGANVVNAAELPVLLPSEADAGSLIVVGNRDSYSAHFTTGGRAYSLYGSRLLTVASPARGAARDETNLTIIRSDEALTGSFALYGASYSLTRHCINESVEDDPACHDADALGEIAAGLVVVVGDAGKGRP